MYYKKSTVQNASCKCKAHTREITTIAAKYAACMQTFFLVCNVLLTKLVPSINKY